MMNKFDPNIHERFFVERQLGGVTRKLYGIRDKFGNVIIEPQYTKLTHWGDGILMAMFGGGRALIDLEHEIVPMRTYQFISSLSCGYSIVINYSIKGDKYGLIDTQGNLILPLVFDKIWDLDPKCDSIKVMCDGKKGEIYIKDLNSNGIVPTIHYESYHQQNSVSRNTSESISAEDIPMPDFFDFVDDIIDSQKRLEDLEDMKSSSALKAKLYAEYAMADREHYAADKDVDWKRESFYALTDGQYGDYEDGDVDPDCLGF